MHALKKVRSVYLLQVSFFGLTPDFRQYQMEEFYVLIKQLNFTYRDAYSLPVWKRRWFLKKFMDDLEKQKNKLNQSAAKNIPSRNNSKRIFK